MHQCCQQRLSMKIGYAVGFLFMLVASTSNAQVGPAQQTAVPTWLAWREFHASLSAFQQRSIDINKLLQSKFGLTDTQVSAVVSAGQSFLASIQRIDTDAKAEALRRYPDLISPRISHRPIRRSSTSSTLRDRAIKDGLYAEVEGKKEVALAKHLQSLALTLGPQKLDVVRNWVQTSISPNVQIYSGPPPVRREWPSKAVQSHANTPNVTTGR